MRFIPSLLTLAVCSSFSIQANEAEASVERIRVQGDFRQQSVQQAEQLCHSGRTVAVDSAVGITAGQ